MKPLFHPVLCFALLCGTLSAADPPGIPEPPLLLYGSVTDGGTNQLVTLNSVSWQATDGIDSATLSAVSTPPARLVSQSGQSFYLAEIPFDTRVVQNPVGQPLSLLRNGQSLELKSPSPEYTLTPFINGRRATIRSIDGTPASSGTLRLSNSPETNGRMLRVELTLPPVGSYAEWALAHFPNPDAPAAALTMDFDGDGTTNEQEFLAGTQPTDSQSNFRISSITSAPDGSLTLVIRTIPGKRYQLTGSDSLKSFELLGTPFTATGQETLRDLPAQGAKRFFRLEIVP